MPSDDSSVRDALNHQSLQVKPGRPGPRPIIAVLDARPGLAGQLREKIAELAAQVRREPGCLTFTAYEARDVPGRFYLYEVYASAAAFAAKPHTSGTPLSEQAIQKIIEALGDIRDIITSADPA